MQARLLQMHRETEDLRAAGKIEQLVLAINRSDYMLDEPSNTLLQVLHPLSPSTLHATPLAFPTFACPERTCSLLCSLADIRGATMSYS